MKKTGNVSSARYSSTGKTGESTEVRQLAGVDRALEDLRLEAYWQRCLLATVILRQVGKVAEVEAMAESAEARARSGAALGYGEKPRDWGKEIAKARAQIWDAEGLPWSALILAAVWDERCPLTCREMAEWIRGIGRRVTSVNALRATVKQLYGVGMLQRWPKGYALDPQVHDYFRERWGTRQGIEVRWGLVGTVVNDVGFDPKETDETTLLRMASEAAIPSTKMAAKAEIERRKDRGIWRMFGRASAHASEEEAPAKDWGVEKPREYGRVQEAAPTAAVGPGSTPKKRPATRMMFEPIAGSDPIVAAREQKYYDEVICALPLEPADGGDAFSQREAGKFSGIHPAWLSDEQKAALAAYRALPKPAAHADGVSLYSVHHPPVVEGDENDDISEAAVEEVEIETADTPEPAEEDGCPNDPDDAPDDIDVIYPTEDELAAIMRGEVVGPAVPEGFDTDPADEG